MKITVIGSGGWGTALARLLVKNGHSVTLWSYLEEEAAHLRETGENPLLPGVALPEMTFTSAPACVAGKQLVVMASPSFAAASDAPSAAAPQYGQNLESSDISCPQAEQIIGPRSLVRSQKHHTLPPKRAPCTRAPPAPATPPS